MKAHSHIVFYCLLISLIITQSCVKPKADSKYRIGVSQCVMDDEWRKAMIREMQIEASNYDNIEIIVKDAQLNNHIQIRQIEELIAEQVDVLIISPLESEPITHIAEKAYKKGIPTIITDRKINSDLYTSYVGANNYDIGLAAGNYALPGLKKDAVILEIWGLQYSSPAQERHQGFVDALITRPDIRFKKIEGEWLYDTALVRLKELAWPLDVDYIYSHNDMMAIATREYFVEKDPLHGHLMPVIGVDAVSGAGLEAVADGRIDVSFLYPTGGAEVLQTAMKILNGEEVEKNRLLQTGLINKENAKTHLIQSSQLLNYQQQIERQRNRLQSLFDDFYYVRSSLYIISCLMLGFILLSIYTFRINKKLKSRNKDLRTINKREEEQREKLVLLNAEIKAVTAQKMQFFTNISHEVRTPLTLIIGPLDKLINQVNDSAILSDLQLIKRNADHLLHVINQILDFRKLDKPENKVHLQAQNIVSFVEEIKVYFDSLARSKQIKYEFSATTDNLIFEFDADLMEKVIINLLSNAFKFTPDKGEITIRIFDDEYNLFIEIADTGIGIQPENISFLFDRFFTSDRKKGSGIGLHMVKEYVTLLRGDIYVKSTPGSGTSFTIQWPKPIVLSDSAETSVSHQAYAVSQLSDEEENSLLSKQYPYTVLIVEDDADVQRFLKDSLSYNFQILTANNGKEALTLLESQNVSLILSDVMMPEMNGFELCKRVKSNDAISYIPVILLTALSDEKQCHSGLSGGADDYIQKPFKIGRAHV